MKDLRERRLKLGITQKELARRVGCDQSRISKFESGRRVLGGDMRVMIESALGNRQPVERTAEERELYEIWCRDYAPEREMHDRGKR